MKTLALAGLALVLCLSFSGCGSSSSPNVTSELSIPAGTSLPTGQVNTAYSATLTASGGTPPYSWSVASGSLPAGLSLSAGGIISGTPSASGTSSFTVQVSDAEANPQRATAALSITIAPAPLTITTTSLPTGNINTPYSATLMANGGVPPYSWSLTSGSLPAGLTLSAGGAISGTPTAGGVSNFSLQVADSQSSPQTATGQFSISITTQIQVTTQHNDNSRTGQNLDETILTPASVSSGQFGKLFSYTVDGYVYAQPLYLWNVNIPGKGVHNVIYVATEHDSVYALDADSNAGGNSAPLWQASFIDPAHGITPISSSDLPNCFDAIVPEVGITSTPVIDLSSNTLYVLAETKENGNFYHRLHALDITTGAEKFGGPVAIAASVPGTGSGSSGGILTFDPLQHLNRPGILLSNGNVFMSWSSNCDVTPWHGWVMAYDAATLAQKAVWAATPNGNAGGVWMSGSGVAADSSGTLFVPTGNGTFETTGNPTDFGDSIVKLMENSSGFTLADYFTPYNEGTLEQEDHDVASGGVLLLPDQSGPHVHELIQSGKEGSIYVVDRDNMGHFNSQNNSQIVQNLTGQIGGIFGAPSYWNNNVYFGGRSDALKAFSLTNGLLSATPTSASSTTFGFPGPTVSISANGTTNAIAWVVQTDTHNDGNAVLRAYDATNLGNEFYDSNQNLPRDNPGPAVRFVLPTVANGKVYVGAQLQVSAYGLLPQH